MSLRDWGWFVIIQKTRGLIGLPNPEEELRQLEEKANATYGEYKKALDLTAELEQSNIQIKEEINELTSTLAKAQGDISQVSCQCWKLSLLNSNDIYSLQYTERQAKATAEKIELEAELADTQQKLQQEEASRIELTAEVKKHAGSINIVKKDIQVCNIICCSIILFIYLIYRTSSSPSRRWRQRRLTGITPSAPSTTRLPSRTR